MSNAHNTNEQDTPRDERRAEHDAKRDMIDAAKQDAYDARFRTVRTGRSRCDVPNISNGPQTIRQALAEKRWRLDQLEQDFNKIDPEIMIALMGDEQETTED